MGRKFKMKQRFLSMENNAEDVGKKRSGEMTKRNDRDREGEKSFPDKGEVEKEWEGN
jgi:hypothetical protein